MHTSKDSSWLDRLLDCLFRWIDAPLVKQAAGEVARECRGVAWQQVSKPARGMSRHQARGYVRAMAPALVVQEVDAVLNRRRLGPHLRPHVVAEATEQVVEVVVRDIFSAPPRAAATSRAKAA